MSDVYDVNGEPKATGSPVCNEIAVLAHELFFIDEKGKRFWQLLRKELLEQPVAPLQYTAAYARFREGQNSIIRLIEQYVQEFLNKERGSA